MCMAEPDPSDADIRAIAELCIVFGEYAGCAACREACSEAWVVDVCATRRKRANLFSGSSVFVEQSQLLG